MAEAVLLSLLPLYENEELRIHTYGRCRTVSQDCRHCIQYGRYLQSDRKSSGKSSVPGGISGIDGIVAGNTTRSRDGLTSISAEKIAEIGNGGLSGAPLHKKNLELVRYVHEKSEGRLPIIGVGGIMSPEDAKEMMDAGASLVEIYSGFIYEGPALVKKIIKHLES